MLVIDMLLELVENGRRIAQIRLNYAPRAGEIIPHENKEFRVLELERTSSDEGSICGIARVRQVA